MRRKSKLKAGRRPYSFHVTRSPKHASDKDSGSGLNELSSGHSSCLCKKEKKVLSSQNVSALVAFLTFSIYTDKRKKELEIGRES